MIKQYPETIEELIDECKALSNRYDLYELGKPAYYNAWYDDYPDGTENLSGEYVYGCAMIPAQWVLHIFNEKN